MKRAKTKTTGTAKKATKHAAAKTKTARATRKSTTRPARRRPRANGDPVIVDDGGSFRIDQRGTEFPGLKRSSSPSDIAKGKFTDGAYLSVTNAPDGGGVEIARVLLGQGDDIRIKATGNVILKVHPNIDPELHIKVPGTAREHGSSGSFRYEVPATGLITEVTRKKAGQSARSVFDKRDYPTIPNVSVIVYPAK